MVSIDIDDNSISNSILKHTDDNNFSDSILIHIDDNHFSDSMFIAIDDKIILNFVKLCQSVQMIIYPNLC